MLEILEDTPKEGTENVSQTPEPDNRDRGLEINREAIESQLSGIESLINEPIRKRKRGRPRKSEKTSEDQAPTTFDAAQIEGTLTGLYFQFVGVIARCPLVVSPEQQKTAGPLITHCINKYLPGQIGEHLPLAALAFMTLDIVMQSKRVASENEKEKESH